MSLKERIQNDMKDAMRAKEQKRLDVIRLLLAALKQREVDERIVLTDNQVLEILGKMIKQRRDSVAQYQTAGRQDLVDQENYEITLLQQYLPTQLSEADLIPIIKDAITTSGATSAKDIGKVMAIVKPKVQGQADMTIVSAKVKEILG